MPCNKCKTQNCTCKPAIPCYTSTGCPDGKVNASCVFYKLNTNITNLTKYIELPGNTSLEVILEKLDILLFDDLRLEIPECAESILNLEGIVSVKSSLIAVINRICNFEDVKVKASASDSTSGYLTDKIRGHECLEKRIITLEGVQTVEFFINYDCLGTKLPTCIEIDCCGGTGGNFNISTSSTSTCGDNLVTLTATNCENIEWYQEFQKVGEGSTIQVGAGIYYAICNDNISNTIVITNIGSCQDCFDTLPTLSISGTVTQVCGVDPDPILLTATANGCSNISWWMWEPQGDLFLGNGNTKSVVPQGSANVYFSKCSNCAGEVISNTFTIFNIGVCGQTTFTAQRHGMFTRNNCAQNCNSIAVPYSKTYISYESQQVVDLLALNDSNFNTDGQNFANGFGICTNCVTITYTATLSRSATVNYVKDNCELGCYGLPVSFTQSAIVTRTSTNSQLEADTLAAQDALAQATALADNSTNGQAFANASDPLTNCNCEACVPIVSAYITFI